ncbi:MAG TPA: type IV toxin-antitoxin system AbiEi family antitoxin [Planctomycetota bacterium]|nr:type IV toxin-antitoxin system AbiEi family antitoxin [Planctomycetota bacterium]
MNTGQPPTERALLAKLHDILTDLAWSFDLQAEPRGIVADDQFDATVRLHAKHGKNVVLAVECKRDLRPVTFQPWAQRMSNFAMKRRATPVLGMPSVSPRMAELCRAQGMGWFDLAGNCRIDVPGLLHIERTGSPPIHRQPREGASLGTAAAARVLRVLLSPGNAGKSWKQRDLRAHTIWRIERDAPVSIGLVNKLIRHLVDQGFIEASRGEGIRVRDPAGLLTAWRTAYRFDRHERRSYFTLLKGPALGAKLYKVAMGAADAAVYAVFSAAERQAPHVRQPKTWIYVRPPYLDAVIRETSAKEVDSGENLVVLVPEDSGVFLSFDADTFVGEASIGCTDPVQTYVDLMQFESRGEEAANALLQQKILRSWKAAGIG